MTRNGTLVGDDLDDLPAGLAAQAHGLLGASMRAWAREPSRQRDIRPDGIVSHHAKPRGPRRLALREAITRL